MSYASNASGMTNTTITLLDDNASSDGGHSATTTLSRNGDDSISCRTTPSLSSCTSARSSIKSTSDAQVTVVDSGRQVHEIYNYKLRDFVSYTHPKDAKCEDVCLYFCRLLNILPTTRLLFGLRVYDVEGEWAVPGCELTDGVRYCFRMRFKLPALDTQLMSLDSNAYDYLYSQMRVDMVGENIPEIRYPAQKDNVMGLGVVDMYIDLLEERDSAERIEANYKRYLPRQLVKAHKVFVRPKICKTFRQLRGKANNLGYVKLKYVLELHKLAPNYLLETYTAYVDFIPGEEEQPTAGGHNATTAVNVKLDLYDTPEPGMKISRKTTENNLTWILVAKLENIYALYTEDPGFVRLEITGFPNGFRMRFERKADLESFITYLGGYIRLTSKWMLDLYVQHPTPSLEYLKALRCHGPIGGSYSFAKIREKRNQCGSFIIRECEKEYDTLYIDINTKSSGVHPEKCKTETFKIKKDNKKWILHFNDSLVTFDDLQELPKYIPTDGGQKFRIPPSEYDKPPLLLICLPKNFQSKNTETELSEAELQRKRVQIFDPKIDLQWYKNSLRECDNGKMVKMRADWLQGSYKDVCVTLKVLKYDADFPEFMKLANAWSQIYSPQFVKLYGLTLSTPYTMVMEHCKFGPLNEFLAHHGDKVSLRALLDVVLGLVRGIVYMKEYNIIHGYIRCSNLYVTKFDPKTNLLEAKIADPGYPRPYHREELPWIPFECYNDINSAKLDPHAEMWAFATTIWEIFARGEPIRDVTSEALHENYSRYGGILPMPRDCPEDMYVTMMDGWNKDEPDKRFNHQQIFSRLIRIKESSNYVSVANGTSSETLSIKSAYSNMTKDTFNSIQNGHSVSDIQSVTFSTTSSMAEQAAQIVNQQKNSLNTPHNLNHGIEDGRPRYLSYFDHTQSVVQTNNGKVIYKKKIGEGHYGTVYLGEICYDTPNMKREQVAIKTLKPHPHTEVNKEFMREIEIMQALNHPNIVKIKQWIDDPISIIMEYLECGSFIVYLSSRKPNLTNEKLLRFALDIAKGMDYLRSANVIHRDLAARNILVDRDRVKISDFGLAQIANSDGYYYAQSTRDIPIKWYSPESLKTEKFSFQSDVWSYGVTLFEMFSRGEIPNLDPKNELTHLEILNRLEKGDRLRKPALCPDIVYEKLMLPCWNADPKSRPDFKKIIELIHSINYESGESV